MTIIANPPTKATPKRAILAPAGPDDHATAGAAGSAPSGRESGRRSGGSILLLAVALLSPPASAKCSVGKLAELSVTMSGLRPMVSGRINGAEARFLLDSGAAFSLLTPATATDRKLNLRDAPTGFFVRGVGGSETVSLTTVREFTLGRVPLKNIEFIVGGSEPGGGAAGVLGQNILSAGGDVEYDLANGVVRLMRSHDCAKTDLSYWDTAGAHSVLSIEAPTPGAPHTVAVASINGRPMRVLFDSGAAVSSVGRRSAERAGVTIESPGATASGALTGFGQATVRTWIVPVASFSIGDEQIRNTHLLVTDQAPADGIDMMLGADFFLSHHLYVSGSQRKLYFTFNGGPVFNLALVPGAATSAASPGVAAPEAEPSDAAGFARRGSAFAARHDYARAIADLDRACELDPSDPRAFYARGVALSHSAKLDAAAADFDTALRLKPDDLQTLVARAGLRVSSGDRDGAAADLDAIDRVATADSDARFDAAGLDVAIDRFPEAIRQLDLWLKAHSRDGRIAAALHERCRARALWGQELDQALKDCDTAVKRMPGQAGVLGSRGLVQLRRGSFDKAIADYDTALRINPRSAWSLYGRGIAKSRLGRVEDGTRDIENARALLPRIADDARDRGIAP